MLNYLLQRLATIIPTLFFVSVIIFGLQQLLPGDPASALAGEERDPNVIAFIRAKYHLDQPRRGEARPPTLTAFPRAKAHLGEPLPVRYALWVGGVFHGDLGESIRIGKP